MRSRYNDEVNHSLEDPSLRTITLMKNKIKMFKWRLICYCIFFGIGCSILLKYNIYTMPNISIPEIIICSILMVLGFILVYKEDNLKKFALKRYKK